MIFRGRFAGKVAVVTGAAQGIGRTVALRIAREGGWLRWSIVRRWSRRSGTRPKPPAPKRSLLSPILRPFPVPPPR
jgi:hypothetical protein